MTVAPRVSSPVDSSKADSPRRAGALVLAVLFVMFSAGALAGFVYAHEPTPPELRTRLVPPAPVADSVLRGTVANVTPGSIEVSTAAGSRRLQLVPDAVIEELAPLEGAVPEGASVNVGGHRTESGFVITGVVVLPDGAR